MHSRGREDLYRSLPEETNLIQPARAYRSLTQETNAKSAKDAVDRIQEERNMPTSKVVAGGSKSRRNIQVASKKLMLLAGASKKFNNRQNNQQPRNMQDCSRLSLSRMAPTKLHLDLDGIFGSPDNRLPSPRVISPSLSISPGAAPVLVQRKLNTVQLPPLAPASAPSMRHCSLSQLAIKVLLNGLDDTQVSRHTVGCDPLDGETAARRRRFDSKKQQLNTAAARYSAAMIKQAMQQAVYRSNEDSDQPSGS